MWLYMYMMVSEYGEEDNICRLSSGDDVMGTFPFYDGGFCIQFLLL